MQVWLNGSVLGLEVGHGHHRRQQYGNLVRTLVHDLGSRDELGILDKVAGVLQVDLKLVGDLVQARLLMKAWAANSKPSAILGAEIIGNKEYRQS